MASHLRTPLLLPASPKSPGQRRSRGLLASIAACLASFFATVWVSAKNDPSNAIHSLKMAFALVLAFLLVLLEQLGNHAIWAIMTVIVVFEFSIGATLSKGCNRGAGTLLAGLLAIALGQLARISGSVGHPIMIGVSVFVTGGVVTFAKLWPTMKKYEFGFRTFLITFSLIMVAEARGGQTVSTAVERFLVILVGAAIGFVVNIFILPCWAGVDLHQLIAKNFESVADSLEACVSEYLKGAALERVPSKILMGLAADDPVYKGYRSALISASKEESLALFASWEPPHGRFRMCNYPWQQYVKAPLAVRRLFEREFCDVSVEGAQVLRELGKQVRNMERGDLITILNGVRQAVQRLQQSLYMHSYLLVRQEMGILEEAVEDLSLSMIPQITRPGDGDSSSKLFRARSTNKLGILCPHDESSDTSRRCFKKLYTWPSRPVDDFDFAKDSVLEQRVRVLESANALSLGTFATLLMEVALRLDYVVEAVEELGRCAKFKAVTELQGSKHPQKTVEVGQQIC